MDQQSYVPPPPPPGVQYTVPKAKRKTPVVLIVCICAAAVVGGVTVLLILMVMAIPAMQKTIIRANETSAIASLRMLNAMEGEYNSTYPQHGFACSLSALGGKPGSGTPKPDSAQLIGDDLASGTKAGYTFTFSSCTKVTVKNIEMHTGYTLIAVPNSVGHTGRRGFCTNENGQIRYDPKGGTNCTELLQ